MRTQSPDIAAILAAHNPFARSQHTLFERGQVTAVDGNQVAVRVAYGEGDAPLLLEEVPVLAGYNPKVGDWVKIEYEGGHPNAPWIVGPSMADDASADPAGVRILTQRSAPPPAPMPGETYYDLGDAAWKGWDGTHWVSLATRDQATAYIQLDADIQTSNTTWAPVSSPALQITFDKQLDPSLLAALVVAASWENTVALAQCILALDVDGTYVTATGMPKAVIDRFSLADLPHHPRLLALVSSLAPGSHVITPIWRVTAGIGTISRPRLWVLELR